MTTTLCRRSNEKQASIAHLIPTPLLCYYRTVFFFSSQSRRMPMILQGMRSPPDHPALRRDTSFRRQPQRAAAAACVTWGALRAYYVRPSERQAPTPPLPLQAVHRRPCSRSRRSWIQGTVESRRGTLPLLPLSARLLPLRSPIPRTSAG